MVEWKAKGLQGHVWGTGYKCWVREERVAAPLIPQIALGQRVTLDGRRWSAQERKTNEMREAGAVDCATDLHRDDRQTRAMRAGGGAIGIACRHRESGGWGRGLGDELRTCVILFNGKLERNGEQGEGSRVEGELGASRDHNTQSSRW